MKNRTWKTVSPRTQLLFPCKSQLQTHWRWRPAKQTPVAVRNLVWVSEDDFTKQMWEEDAAAMYLQQWPRRRSGRGEDIHPLRYFGNAALGNQTWHGKVGASPGSLTHASRSSGEAGIHVLNFRKLNNIWHNSILYPLNYISSIVLQLRKQNEEDLVSRLVIQS